MSCDGSGLCFNLQREIQGSEEKEASMDSKEEASAATWNLLQFRKQGPEELCL